MGINCIGFLYHWCVMDVVLYESNVWNYVANGVCNIYKSHIIRCFIIYHCRRSGFKRWVTILYIQ